MYDRIRQKARKYRLQNQSGRLIPGEITARLNDSGVTSVKVDDADTKNLVWVKLYGQDERIIQALNIKVTPRDKMPVLLRRMSTGEFVIAEGDPVAGTELYGEGAASVFLQELIGELLATVWGARNLKPGRARLSQAGGLNLEIEAFHHASGYFPGGTIDLTDYVPTTTDKKAWVKVWYDPNNEELGATLGTEYDLPYTLTEIELGDVRISSNYIPLAGIILTEGDTTITASHTLVAAQNWIDAPVGTGSLWPITITDSRSIPENAQIAVRRQTIGPGGVLTVKGVLDVF